MPLFAPILSAALVVLSVMFAFVFGCAGPDGACVLLRPGIWSERGPVDLGICEYFEVWCGERNYLGWVRLYM